MTQANFSVAGLNVFLAMPTHRDLPIQTVISLLETQALFQRSNIPLTIQLMVGSSIIEAARTRAAYEFLKTDCNRLFWVDSDIAWKASDFLRLVAFSSKLDLVCGAYPAKTEPTEFRLNAVLGAEVETNEYGCIRIPGIGLGFVIVNRAVMEALAAKAPLLTFPDVSGPIPHIFGCDTSNGLFRGEDMRFFSDAAALGYSAWLDPTVRLSHIGAKAYSGCVMDILEQTA